MIAQLKPYLSTKDSGVAWLGRVPTHWNVVPNRAVFSEVNERGHPTEQLLAVTISQGVLPQTRLLKVSAKKDSSQLDRSDYKLVRPGDIAYNKMRAWQGALGMSAYTGIVSPAYVVQRPRSADDPRYLHYLFRTEAFAKEAERWSYGITSDMWSLRGEHFRLIHTCLPPLSEQSAIARFLDHADRRIQRYIRTKEKLIALLEEQKQAIIHQAVTGQIDVRTGQPYSAYKPSGVEWLCDVPAHWQVLHLGRLISLKVGFPFKSGGFTQSERDIRLLRGINVAPRRMRWDDVVRWSADDVDGFSEYRVEAGDVILGMDRPIVGSGIRVAIVTETDLPALLLQRVARIRPRDGIIQEFVFQILSSRSFSYYLSPIFTGVSVPHLSPEQIRAFEIALPSIVEQRDIVQYLTSQVTTIQATAERAEKQIGLLRENRSRLIADVVTGNLDVREAAATLREVDPFADGDEADDSLDTGNSPTFDQENQPVRVAG